MATKQIILPSIPNVGFFEWNTYEECKLYNQNLTIEEYNKAFGIKTEKKDLSDKKLKVDLNDKKG